jgi:hypothetical protein
VAWFGGCSGDRILFTALSNAACLKRHWIEEGDTNHSVFAMGSHGHQGGVVSELLLANAPEIPKRLRLTRSSRSHYDHARIRGTIPVTTAITASNLRRDPGT